MAELDSSTRAVITGIGPVTPIGIGKENLWRGLKAQKTAIHPLTRFDSTPYRAKFAAQIDDFAPEKYLPPIKCKRMDRYTQMAVVSAALALQDAKLDPHHDLNPKRAGVSFGSAVGGFPQAEHDHIKFLEHGIKSLKPSMAFHVFPGTAHTNVSLEYSLQGAGTTNSNSCASGNIALIEAARLIQNGEADVMLAGASEAPLAPMTFAAFDRIHTMSPVQSTSPRDACKPFDRNRSGFVMSEGSACFVLESLHHAQNRGAHIYAEITGWSVMNEAFHMTSPNPNAEVLTSCIQETLERANLEPTEIDCINPHGSCTDMNDANEVLALQKVFGPALPSIPITGTKAYTGHSLGAAGAIEAAITLCAMEHSWLPPTLHLDDPLDPNLDFVANTGRTHSIRRALNNSFGFGGIDSSLVLAKLNCP